MSEAEGLEMRLREEIKRLFEEAMSRYGIKQNEAAKQIGITPQQFGNYLAKGATPSAFVFLTACKIWNLKVIHENVEFGVKKLSNKQRSRLPSPDQLLLFSALKELGDDSLGIRINKKGPDRLDLSLEIKFVA